MKKIKEINMVISVPIYTAGINTSIFPKLEKDFFAHRPYRVTLLRISRRTIIPFTVINNKINVIII